MRRDLDVVELVGVAGAVLIMLGLVAALIVVAYMEGG